MEFPLSERIAGQEKYHILGRTADTNVTIKELKDAMVVAPTRPFLTLLFGMCRRQTDHGELKLRIALLIM